MSAPKVERWGFTEAELKHPERCKGTDEQIATCPLSREDAPEFDTWRERGIIVYRNGKVSNRYGDGTRGPSAEEVEYIEDGEPATYKPDGESETPDGNDWDVDTWLNVKTNEKGEFLGFAEED